MMAGHRARPAAMSANIVRNTVIDVLQWRDFLDRDSEEPGNGEIDKLVDAVAGVVVSESSVGDTTVSCKVCRPPFDKMSVAVEALSVTQELFVEVG
jgi:hypothetical protein